jgi:trk system potassium uptake protein TrkA
MEQSATADWKEASVTKTPVMTTETMLVAGGEHVGELLTEQLDACGETVMFLDEGSASVERALDGGLTAEQIDPTDARALDGAGIDNATIVFVASGSDSRNLLTAQLLAVRFGVDRIIVRVNDPRNYSAFEDIDVETVDATYVLAAALAETAGPQQNE